jgi:hypothetical protein
MKKLLALFVATLALTGCANRYVGPALVGGVVGYSIANSHRPVVVQEQVIVVSAQCNQYAYQAERTACERGARQRYYEEQRRRENEAYRNGYGR